MLLLFSTALAGTTVTDVSSKFWHYAYGFCNGDIHNADVGNGNMAGRRRRIEEEHMDAFKLGALHSQLSPSEMYKLDIKPGRNTTELGTSSSCNQNTATGEKDGSKTCVKSAGVWHWCNYVGYKCMSKYSGQYGDVTYYNMVKSPAVPETALMFYDNAFPRNTSTSIFKDMSSTNTQTLSMTVGFDIGMKMSITAGEPGIFSESEEFTWSFDMHVTTSNTQTTKDEFSWTGDIPEDEYSTTMLLLTVTKESYAGDWKARIKFPEHAKLWCGSRVNGHYEHFIGASTFLKSGPYYGKGAFTGGAGLDIHAVVKKCPLYASTSEECDAGSAISNKFE